MHKALAIRAIVLLLGLVFYSNHSIGQDLTKLHNIGFNSFIKYDSTVFVKDNKVFHPYSNPNIELAIQCHDYGVAPDSSKLNGYLKNNHDRFVKLKADSSTADSLSNLVEGVYDVGKITLSRGFYGLYKQGRIFDNIKGSLNYQEFNTYNYDEHCYCEFQFKRFYGMDVPTLNDSILANQFANSLITRSMDEVRLENKEIRERYRLRIDTLPLENYWLKVYYKDGKMTRDSFFMSDLDSMDFTPRFTHYNTTFNGLLIIEPPLDHTYLDIHLENVKSMDISTDTIAFTLRDVESGTVSKYGFIRIENSLGYPIELPFRFSYNNHLYDRLKRVRSE